MAFTITNYFYVDPKDVKNLRYNLLNPQNSENGFCIVGTVLENSYFGKTNRIETISNGIAVDVYGHEYILKDMDPDYKEYVEAIDNDLPVINSWKIKGDLRNGYQLTGKNLEEKTIRGKIISQRGNFVTLDDNVEYFVNWRGFDEDFVVATTAENRYCDIKYYEDFSKFAGYLCRPNLFNYNR